MLSLNVELEGIRQAARDVRARKMVAAALTGELATTALGPHDQKTFLETATRHGVLGLTRFDHVAYDSMVIAARARNLRALRFTRRVVDAIERAGVPTVVLKGVAAGSRWPDPTLRQQSDVDVLVEKQHKDTAARALIEAGVCADRFLDSERMHNDSLSPADPSGLMVELHHYFNNHHPAEVPIAQLLARRQRLPSGQGELPVLAPEDDAVFLALHATTHALARLAWIVDLAHLPVDWLEAARRAHAWNLSLGVAPAWHCARELLGVPIPEAAFETLKLSRLHWAWARTVLSASDHSGAELHRFSERTFRLSVVPLRALPGVILQKLAARGEEHRAYAKKATPLASNGSD